MRTYGTVARGIRTPIIKEGDDLVSIVVSSILDCTNEESVSLHDNDIVGVTESVVARAQGNYATTDDIAKVVREAFPGGEAVVLFPILSRNRFSTLLEGISKGLDRCIVMLSYPTDEVGNALLDYDLMLDKNINPYTDVLTVEEFRALFGHHEHLFTGIDYIDYYLSLSDNIEIVLANDPVVALDYSPHCLVANVHERARTKKRLKKAGAQTIVGLDDLLTSSVDGSGYNPEYGLLGSNKAAEGKIKLFPRDNEAFVASLAEELFRQTGKKIEVLIYGDGAFKDPVGHIWELADPLVSPAYTEGLLGTPNEIKLKYLADNELDGLSGQELEDKMRALIADKDKQDKQQLSENLAQMGKVASIGTTPRQVTDLLGSLCDLISGSGDKGTPVVLIQGYFDNYATNKKE